MKFITKLHKMAAARFSFIQYPNISGGTKRRFFANEMPLSVRFFVFSVSLVTMLIGLCMLAFLLYWGYFLFIA